MPSSNDCDQPPAEALPVGIKVLVAGGFGVGKTTFVNTLSEIEPLSTEEMLTAVSAATDRLDGVENKATTTVALDFGRITLSPSHVLYLFGTPGQERFWFMWDELSEGALGAVVLADTRRLEHSFAAVDFFERRGIPFVVAVNEFDGAHRYHAEEVRTALDLRQEVPVALGFLVIAEGDFERAIFGAANYGRDNDSIASMAGAIAGAMHGDGVIRPGWIATVNAANRDDLDPLTRDLTALAIALQQEQLAAAQARQQAFAAMQATA